MHLLSRRVRPALTFLTCAIALAAAPTAAHADEQTTAAIAALNAIRAQAGIPFPVAEDPTLNAHCQLHAEWMRANGVIQHAETLGSPGYTLEGNAIAPLSVLALKVPPVPMSSAATNPWYPGSPIHLFQLLHPALQKSGYGFADGWSCMATVESFPALIDVLDDERGRDKIYTFPPDKAKGVPVSEDTSREVPSPNAMLGLEQGRLTGPYMLVFASGFGTGRACLGTSFVKVSLTDPRGRQVKVRSTHEGVTRAAAGVAATTCLLPFGGGYIVPESPLRAGTTYTASVTVEGNGRNPKQGTKTWSFTTAGDAAKPIVGFRKGKLTRTRSKTKFQLQLTVRDESAVSCRWRRTTTVGRRKPVGRSSACKVKGATATIKGSVAGKPARVGVQVTLTDANGHTTQLTRVLR